MESRAVSAIDIPMPFDPYKRLEDLLSSYGLVRVLDWRDAQGTRAALFKLGEMPVTVFVSYSNSLKSDSTGEYYGTAGLWPILKDSGWLVSTRYTHWLGDAKLFSKDGPWVMTSWRPAFFLRPENRF